MCEQRRSEKSKVVSVCCRVRMMGAGHPVDQYCFLFLVFSFCLARRVSFVVKKSKRTQHERREGERQKKVVGSGVVLRAQQRCAGIGKVCVAN